MEQNRKEKKMNRIKREGIKLVAGIISLSRRLQDRTLFLHFYSLYATHYI